MVQINPAYGKLAAGYLFPEIAKRTREFIEKNPDARIIRLGIGDTTEPLAPSITAGLSRAVEDLSRRESYSGYGSEQGEPALRERISELKYKGVVTPDEIFISDGAKPDSGNIQEIFSSDAVVAVQDPAYPVYVDSTVMNGKTGNANANGQYEGIVYMPCTEDNNFFPELPSEKVDIIFFCSPNNPTGMAASKKELTSLVDFARDRKAVIIFDAAYERFISDPALPRSIYEIDGARECAIEIGSFSKEAGFTGVRLGWMAVPTALKTEENEDGLVNRLWDRRQSTKFNGASNIAQRGGLAVLGDDGQRETQKIIDHYMNNARAMREGLIQKGLKVYGGENAPYIWARTPEGFKSWDFFDLLLTRANVVVTPGSGFGPSGEGFFRLSAFGSANDVKEAVERIKDVRF